MKNCGNFFKGCLYRVNPFGIDALLLVHSNLELLLYFFVPKGTPRYVSLTVVKQTGAMKPQQNILGAAGIYFVYCSAPKDPH